MNLSQSSSSSSSTPASSSEEYDFVDYNEYPVPVDTLVPNTLHAEEDYLIRSDALSAYYQHLTHNIKANTDNKVQVELHKLIDTARGAETKHLKEDVGMRFRDILTRQEHYKGYLPKGPAQPFGGVASLQRNQSGVSMSSNAPSETLRERLKQLLAGNELGRINQHGDLTDYKQEKADAKSPVADGEHEEYKGADNHLTVNVVLGKRTRNDPTSGETYKKYKVEEGEVQTKGGPDEVLNLNDEGTVTAKSSQAMNVQTPQPSVKTRRSAKASYKTGAVNPDEILIVASQYYDEFDRKDETPKNRQLDA